MSTTLNDEHWLNLITQCRSSGLTDRQWCIESKRFIGSFEQTIFFPYGSLYHTGPAFPDFVKQPG